MRSIIEETKFRDDLGKLGIDPKRLDQLLEGIVLTVATKPDIYPEVPGKPALRRLRVRPFPGLKCLNIWFSFDNESVRFLEIDVMDDL